MSKLMVISDERISNISENALIPVFNGAASNTYQKYPAQGGSSSLILFNINVPSESVVMDRNVLVQTTINFTITGTGVEPSDLFINYGVTDSIQAFPLQQFLSTCSIQINNATVSTDYKNGFNMLARMIDPDVLKKYQDLTASYIDRDWGSYTNAVGTNSNPMGSASNTCYDNFQPRGAYPGFSIVSVSN